MTIAEHAPMHRGTVADCHRDRQPSGRPRVAHSFDEFSPLREIVVGIPANARIPDGVVVRSTLVRLSLEYLVTSICADG